MNEYDTFQRLVEELKLIADREEFARQAKSSEAFVDEVFCTLFDDLNVESFLTGEMLSGQPELEVLQQFVSSANAAADELPTHVNALDLLRNRHWDRAQSLALEFLQLRNRTRQ